MHVSIADLKSHVVSFIQNERLALDAAEHRLVARFATFVEGKQSEHDAVAYLEAKGYTVNAPTTAAPPEQPAAA